MFGDISEPSKHEQGVRMRADFVRAMVDNGGNQKAAARTAGYATPDKDGARLVRQPRILAELRRQREKKIQTKLASLALGTMRDLMVDEHVSPAVRFQSARWVLEAAGHNSKEIKQLGFDPDKPLTEMSLTELQAFIAAGSQAVETLKQPRLVSGDGPETIEHDPAPADYEILRPDGTPADARTDAQTGDSAPDSAQFEGADLLMS